MTKEEYFQNIVRFGNDEITEAEIEIIEREYMKSRSDARVLKNVRGLNFELSANCLIANLADYQPLIIEHDEGFAVLAHGCRNGMIHMGKKLGNGCTDIDNWYWARLFPEGEYELISCYPSTRQEKVDAYGRVFVQKFRSDYPICAVYDHKEKCVIYAPVEKDEYNMWMTHVYK